MIECHVGAFLLNVGAEPLIAREMFLEEKWPNENRSMALRLGDEALDMLCGISGYAVDRVEDFSVIPV